MNKTIQKGCAALLLAGIAFTGGCAAASAPGEGASAESWHEAYAYALEDGQFHPDEALTRADAAEWLLAASGEEPKNNAGAGYTDVAPDAPYAGAVAALAECGVISGYPDGSFRPEQNVSRGEFTALVCRMMGVWDEGAPFRDIPDGYWAAGAVAAACRQGWVSGYPDGLFYPEAAVTRAEAVAILNRALGRTGDPELQVPEVGYAKFGDVPEGHWAFLDVMEASVSHGYEVDGTEERWSGYELVPMGAVPGAQRIGEDTCFADPETLELIAFDKGFNLLDGQLFYASEAGYAADSFPTGTVEFQGGLYYVQENGAFLTNGDWGHLHFGPDGRYTSGDGELDALVEELLADVLADTEMSQEEKLYAAYCIIRDDGFTYATRGDVYDRGTTEWALECAKKFYKSKKGTCFYFTSGFMYLARRLGYDAYPVVGGVWSNNAYHSWVMINWPDGEEYIFDVELEWAYLHGYYSDTPKHYDLFKQPVDDSLFIYNFPN